MYVDRSVHGFTDDNFILVHIQADVIERAENLDVFRANYHLWGRAYESINKRTQAEPTFIKIELEGLVKTGRCVSWTWGQVEVHSARQYESCT